MALTANPTKYLLLDEQDHYVRCDEEEADISLLHMKWLPKRVFYRRLSAEEVLDEDNDSAPVD